MKDKPRRISSNLVLHPQIIVRFLWRGGAFRCIVSGLNEVSCSEFAPKPSLNTVFTDVGVIILNKNAYLQTAGTANT